ncbi:unnamed protein product, partial [Mesorhabditis belari]|uniref:Uncharacterized protein n=1 Tax=Mesorhabditis belari TaxID=2138241 RepID=A0AAF3EE61_9BILA
MIGDEYDDEVDQEKNEENEEKTTAKPARAKKFPKMAQKEITTTTQAPDSEQTDDETTTIVESEDQDDQDALLDDGERSYEMETEEETTTKASKKHSNENTKTLKFKKPAREFASKTVTAYKEDRKKKQKEMERQKESAKNVIDQDEDDDVMGDNGGEDDEEEPVNVIPSIQATEDESTRHPFIKSTEVPADPSSLFSEWSDWTPCTKSGERRVRRRKCLDLRRCLGALMQVENCPAVTTPVMSPEDYDQPPLESVRSIVAEPSDRDDFQDQGAQPVPLPPADDQPSVWSPWLGVCQQFASGQPCNNGEMIGFESRECLAKDSAQCTGPFFRYCTLNC